MITDDGNDTLINQILSGVHGAPFTVGTNVGTVDMGIGNDAGLDTGVLGNVALGDGIDTCTVGGFFEGGLDIAMANVGTSGDVCGGIGNDTMTGGASDDAFLRRQWRQGPAVWSRR